MENKTYREIKRTYLLNTHESINRNGQPLSEMIPHQLQRSEFRFILIPRGEKVPCEKNWTTINNYRFDDPKLKAWLVRGGNYGVCCGFGDLVGIDADDPSISELFDRHFGPTFRVRSGSGRGFHDYAIVKGMPGKQLFEQNGKHLGEAQFRGQQLVGPGSIHPCGGVYTIVRDVPIVEIDYASFVRAFKGLFKCRLMKSPLRQTYSHLTASQGDLRSIPLCRIITLRGVRRDDEIQGANPWHGSTTGKNFNLNTVRNVWHCFRCNAGGGVAEAIALNEGLIQSCADELGVETFRKVIWIAKQKYGLR